MCRHGDVSRRFGPLDAGLRWFDLACDPIDERFHECVFVGNIVIERHHAGSEFGRELAHAQLRCPLFVGHSERCLHDVFVGEDGLASAFLLGRPMNSLPPLAVYVHRTIIRVHEYSYTAP